jgi:hypothetical protein
MNECHCGVIGSHDGLKTRCPKKREGSSPSGDTMNFALVLSVKGIRLISE